MHTPSLRPAADSMTQVIRTCDLGHTSQWAIKNPALADGVNVISGEKYFVLFHNHNKQSILTL